MQYRTESNIQFRSAQHDDYEAVINILPNAYHGKDPLPCYYHDFLDDQRRVCVIALINGEVAGFAMFFVIDKGTAALPESVRLKDKFQGKGIAPLLMSYALKKTLTKFPKVKKVRSASTDEKMVMKELREVKSAKLLFKFHFISLELDKDSAVIDASLPHPQDVMKKLKLEETRVLTPSEAVDELSGLTDPQRLMHENNTFIMNWEPFTAMPSNYQIMFSGNTMPTLMITQNRGKEIEAMSLGCIINVKIGPAYRFHFLCPKENITTTYGKYLLLTHIVKHLNVLNQHKVKSKLLFDIFLQKEFNPHIVVEAMEMIQVVVKKVRTIEQGFCSERSTVEFTDAKL